MKYYIIAGEASGDLHGANLMKAIKSYDLLAEFRVWGGDLMAEQGGDVVKHYRDLNFMGFVEVLMNIRTISKNLQFCRQDVDRYQPDVLILIDYPGFNLRIAEFAHEIGLKVFYYISPQVWAWKENRVKKIKRVVDEMFVILPFEQEFYRKHDYRVNFVGHPLLDAIHAHGFEKANRETFVATHKLSGKPIIALLPGSRKQEIATKLPIMLQLVKHYPDYEFVLGGAPSVKTSDYTAIMGDQPVAIVVGDTYGLLQQSAAALVTSGTATLETALFKVPEVVCYKGSAISYHIAKRLIKVKYISLVNLIMDREVVKELIQHELTEENIKQELDLLLFDDQRKQTLAADYEALHKKLGGAGASRRCAEKMLEELGFMHQ